MPTSLLRLGFCVSRTWPTTGQRLRNLNIIFYHASYRGFGVSQRKSLTLPFIQATLAEGKPPKWIQGSAHGGIETREFAMMDIEEGPLRFTWKVPLFLPEHTSESEKVTVLKQRIETGLLSSKFLEARFYVVLQAVEQLQNLKSQDDKVRLINAILALENAPIGSTIDDLRLRFHISLLNLG